jgi:peptidoglycan/LPS O-acetylase OafA/YrhL
MVEEETSERRRIDYLDGLRGFAALAVLIFHSLLIFIEPLSNLQDAVGRPGVLISSILKVLGLITNGNSAVCIFFILSGYVMADFAGNTRLGLPAQVVRRYIRLALPVLITSTCAYLLLRYGLFRNTESSRIFGGWLGLWYQFAPSGRAMAFESVIGTFVDGSNAYNPNLWTMHAEIIGSFYVLAIGTIARRRAWRTLLYLCLAAYYVFDYLPLFVVGALLREHDVTVRRVISGVWPPIAVFVLGYYFCSLPELGSAGRFLHLVYPLPQFSYDNTRYWHSIGATLVLLGVLGSPLLQTAFASRAGKFLGRISFTLYLIHVPVFCSLGAWLIVSLVPHGEATAAGIGLLVTITTSIGIATLLSPVVDGGAILLSRYAGRRLDDAIRRTAQLFLGGLGANAASTPARVVTAPVSIPPATRASPPQSMQ